MNWFDCQVCNKRNCLTCKAIHLNMTCQQYQDDLKIKSENDVAAKRTQEMLEVHDLASKVSSISGFRKWDILFYLSK